MHCLKWYWPPTFFHIQQNSGWNISHHYLRYFPLKFKYKHEFHKRNLQRNVDNSWMFVSRNHEYSSQSIGNVLTKLISISFFQSRIVSWTKLQHGLPFIVCAIQYFYANVSAKIKFLSNNEICQYRVWSNFLGCIWIDR